jgi:hypothetical protein
LSWERQQSCDHGGAPIQKVPNRSSSVFGASTYSLSCFHPSITVCESNNNHSSSSTVIQAPSRLIKALAALHLRSLPLPRRLLPNDPVFSDSILNRGLRQRARDERSLRVLQEQVTKAVQEQQDMAYIRRLHEQFCDIAYGKGVTPQEREDFVIVSTATYNARNSFAYSLTL